MLNPAWLDGLSLGDALDAEPLQGGYASKTYRVRTTLGRTAIVKTQDNLPPDLYGLEADGLDALQPSVQAMAEAFPGDAGWPITIALGHALAGRHDDARRVLATITSSELRSMPRTTTWIANVSGLAFAASTCRDLRAAEIAVELLKPFEGQHVVVGALAYRGAVAHWLGVCTATLGEHRDAIQLLDHALDDHRRAQTPPWIAQSTRALAELDARRR